MEAEPFDSLADVGQYYSAALARHGDTPRGVDWNGAEGQTLRFEQLLRLIQPHDGFSVHDIGCGYGAFCEFLEGHCHDFRYHGHDISADMIRAAERRLGGRPHVSLAQGAVPLAPADYAVASGIFNVRLQRSDAEWQRYLEATLDVLHRAGRRGFAFNCLTSYSDPERMRDYLYYANPMELFDRCKRRFSKQVALLHDYGLYEFTIIVRQ